MSNVKHSALIAALILSLATAGSVVAADSRPVPSPHVELDLRPPAITDIYSPEEIAKLLSRSLDDDIEEVRVLGERPETIPVSPTPAIPSGLGAIFWAVTNPLQAWRILAPLAPDQAMPTSVSLHTIAYLPPAAVPSHDPAMFP